jgi:hypothetical protein
VGDLGWLLGVRLAAGGGGWPMCGEAARLVNGEVSGGA